jgi:hypothetical protein
MFQNFRIVSYSMIFALVSVLIKPVEGKAFISEPDVGARAEIKTPKDKEKGINKEIKKLPKNKKGKGINKKIKKLPKNKIRNRDIKKTDLGAVKSGKFRMSPKGQSAIDSLWTIVEERYEIEQREGGDGSTYQISIRRLQNTEYSNSYFTMSCTSNHINSTDDITRWVMATQTTGNLNASDPSSGEPYCGTTVQLNHCDQELTARGDISAGLQRGGKPLADCFCEFGSRVHLEATGHLAPVPYPIYEGACARISAQ